VQVLEAALIRACREEITPRKGYTFFLSEEAMKDIKVLIEAEKNDNRGAQATSSASPYAEAAYQSQRAHSAITDPSQSTGMPDHPDQLSSKAKGLALIKDNEDHDTRSKLSRYEAGLMNAVARTLSLIQAIQASGATSKKMNIARGEHLLLLQRLGSFRKFFYPLRIAPVSFLSGVPEFAR
jgi:hypothetical protein